MEPFVIPLVTIIIAATALFLSIGSFRNRRVMDEVTVLQLRLTRVEHDLAECKQYRDRLEGQVQELNEANHHLLNEIEKLREKVNRGDHQQQRRR